MATPVVGFFIGV